jgi:predicted DNA-binding protein (MmcQ/YjbR family)
MDIEELRTFCLDLPAVTEDIKWENNLVFSVAGKMFCLADLDPPLRVSLKVREEEFEEITSRSDIIQAPYFARMKWVTVMEEGSLSRQEWKHYIRQSYELVKSKLTKKLREGIGNKQSGNDKRVND